MTMMRVAIIADRRHPVAEPFAGGLEAHVWHLTAALRARGHDVTLFAGAGSDPDVATCMLGPARLELSAAALEDPSMPEVAWMRDHHAYLELMLRLGGRLGSSFDVVHNHSLHYLPVAMASTLRSPMITTLHTPPTPWLESAVKASTPGDSRFVAVSRHTARMWSAVVPAVSVVANGVDCARWPAGPGGQDLIWFGRLTPEKAPTWPWPLLAGRDGGCGWRVPSTTGNISTATWNRCSAGTSSIWGTCVKARWRVRWGPPRQPW